MPATCSTRRRRSAGVVAAALACELAAALREVVHVPATPVAAALQFLPGPRIYQRVDWCTPIAATVLAGVFAQINELAACKTLALLAACLYGCAAAALHCNR